MANLASYTQSDGEFMQMPSTEYPVLFWLRPIVENGAGRVFDLGGYFGQAFYQYNKYLCLSERCEWIVYDVAAITREGAAIAERQKAKQLRFSTDIKDADGADVLLAAGSLQYFPEGFLQETLGRLAKRPVHVIVQRTALHPDRSFVTLQSIITREDEIFFCPYTVAHRKRFIEDMAKLDYDLVERWVNERAVHVPLHQECEVKTYSGLYFRLNGS